MHSTVDTHSSIVSWLHCGWRSRLWQALAAFRVRRTARQLRICESLSLGEKRVVAVVQYEGQKFLIGAGTQSVNLLSRLDAAKDFSELLTEWCERQR